MKRLSLWALLVLITGCQGENPLRPGDSVEAKVLPTAPWVAGQPGRLEIQVEAHQRGTTRWIQMRESKALGPIEAKVSFNFLPGPIGEKKEYAFVADC